MLKDLSVNEFIHKYISERDRENKRDKVNDIQIDKYNVYVYIYIIYIQRD